jgi:cell division protein FtsN
VEIQAISTEQATLQQVADQTDSKLYLQIGSFKNKKSAEELHDEVAAHHLPEPEIRHSRTHNRYKVQIGPLASLSDVADLNEQLAAIGITDTQFVTESKQSRYSMIQ